MLRTTPLSVCLALLLLPMSATLAQEQKLPEGAGKDTLVRVCSGCHGPQIVVGRGNTEEGWTQLVLNMIQRGAQGSEDDFAQIVQYLSTNFPASGAKATETAAPKINVNKAAADDLKTGLELSAKEAQSIVTWRDHNGLFKTIDDLKKVPDVDAKKIDAKKDRLTF